MLDPRMMICMCPDEETHARRAEEALRATARYTERERQTKIQKLEAELKAMTVKAEQYDIMEVKRVGPHLVMKVRYPSCTKCSFDGIKVMVFLDVEEMQALKWRRIDPHFRKPTKEDKDSCAPSPSARFPGTEEGWQDALEYAAKKCP